MVSNSDPAHVHWVTTPGALDDWLLSEPDEALALDTEFERISTFYPIPGLVQLGLGEQYCLVDPSVAEQSAEFRRVLADPERPKLLYAMSEDLELFRHWLGVNLVGVLDLQIGASLAGAGFSVGYARLVERLFGHALDKSATRSDWLARPLSPEQESYALDDVRYLKPLYEWVLEGLASKGLTAALTEESARFADDLNSQAEPDQYYLKVRGGWYLNQKQQQLLQALVRWREIECRERDRPRGRVLADNILIAIAESAPANTGKLASLPDMPPVVVRRYGEILLEIVKQTTIPPGAGFAMITPPLTRDEQGIYKKIKRVFADIAEQRSVPVELLAPRRRLEALVREGMNDPEQTSGTLFEGWRGTMTTPAREQIRVILTS
ncbi:ribonuclease D [Marinobacter changyiensis]|uniref:ribonuclease D n=1 Tax=Marinobacter changyiensis TaxID=2604091 RepID=UPI0012640D84|nr:HRDC domain-containing protein [Marinobacter changyiensis]